MKHHIVLPGAVAVATALTSWVHVADAAALPPVPDEIVEAIAAANTDAGVDIEGGAGETIALAHSTGSTNAANGSAFIGSVDKEAANGKAPTAIIGASANASGNPRGLAVADGDARLEFAFRNTQKAPFPQSLFGLPVTLSFEATAAVTTGGDARGEAVIFFNENDPRITRPVLDTTSDSTNIRINFDAAPDEVFGVTEAATAGASCGGNACGGAWVTLDPIISFDQQAFDMLAAARGVPSVPLDQYFTIDFSPGLALLPPVPADLPPEQQMQIAEILGTSPGGAAVPEPGALGLVATGVVGLVAFARRRHR